MRLMRFFHVGFTLIELLIVVAITGVILSASIAGYNTFNQRQILVAAGKELLINLRSAQSNARSGVKPAAGACSPLDGYTVVGVAGGTSYTITARCNGALVPATTKTIRLRDGVTITTAFSITFLGQLGGVLGISGASDDLSLSPPGGGVLRYIINVTTQGAISDMGVQ